MLHPAALHGIVHTVRAVHAAGVWPMDSDHDPDNTTVARVRRIVIALPTLALIVVVWPMLLAGKNRGPRPHRFLSQIANMTTDAPGTFRARRDWQGGPRRAIWRAMTSTRPHRRTIQATTDEAHRIGRNIRAAREQAKLSQPALGALIGKTTPRISEYENGYHVPAPHVLRALEAALDRPVGYFNAEHPELQPNGDGAA